MAYRWKTKIDVDEAVVVLLNSLDDEGGVDRLAHFQELDNLGGQASQGAG